MIKFAFAFEQICFTKCFSWLRHIPISFSQSLLLHSLLSPTYNCSYWEHINKKIYIGTSSWQWHCGFTIRKLAAPMKSANSAMSAQADMTAVHTSATSTALHSRRKDSYFEATTFSSLSAPSLRPLSLESFDNFASNSEDDRLITCCESASNWPQDYNRLPCIHYLYNCILQ